MTQTPPSILFVHDQYPGQFGALAQYLYRVGWDVSFATLDANLPDTACYLTFGYTPHRAPSARTHPYAQPYDQSVLLGQACARSCMRARNAGTLAPDIIISHTGPGAGLFMRDVFPDAFIVAYCEWWYRAPGVDTLYLAALAAEAEAPNLDKLILARSRNASISAELLAADEVLCPTEFQADQFPDMLREKITVCHEGVDTDYFAPLSENVVLGQPDHEALMQVPAQAPVITYATRGMEPHRGFPQVFEAFAQIAAERQDVCFVIAGENQVFYGSDKDREIDWLAQLKAQYPLAPDRLICSGTLTKADYRWLLRRSSAHVYCTVPFVPSWSLLEAMSVGAPLIVSDVAPVREVVPPDGATFADLLTDGALHRAMHATLSDVEGARRMSKVARAKVLKDYDRSVLLERHKRWLLAGLGART